MSEYALKLAEGLYTHLDGYPANLCKTLIQELRRGESKPETPKHLLPSNRAKGHKVYRSKNELITYKASYVDYIGHEKQIWVRREHQRPNEPCKLTRAEILLGCQLLHLI